MKINAYIKKYLKDDLIILAITASIIFVPGKVMAQDEGHEHRPVNQRVLNHFDKNGDGTLNNREAYHARQFHQRIDRNDDGRIGPRERVNARRIQARRNQ